MKIVGAPVGSDIGAVPPDRPDLLPAGGLPNILAVADGLAGEQYPPIGGDHLPGMGGPLLIAL